MLLPPLTSLAEAEKVVDFLSLSLSQMSFFDAEKFLDNRAVVVEEEEKEEEEDAIGFRRSSLSVVR